MEKKTASAIMLTLLLTSMLTLAFNIQPVGATEPTIYITADGSVDPPTAPIRRDGDLYTLTGDISYDIEFERDYHIGVWRDNIVIDGAGFTLQGPYQGCGIGIYLQDRNNVTIKNMGIKWFSSGIALSSSSIITVSKNEIIYCNNGIGISYSSYNNIFGNNITNTIRFYDQSSSFYSQSSNNRFYHNNLGSLVYIVSGSPNIWDDGYPSGGNYWSDYTGVDVKSGPNQDQPGSDCIGDAPYVIDVNNRDHYPLMNPYGAPPPPTYSLTITTTVGGTTDPAPGTYTYTANSTVQVTAIPEANYLFDYWELDTINVGSANPYTVLMNKDHTLKAVYSLIPPPLSASISPLSASILVGQSLTFTSTVYGGYTPYSYQWYLNSVPVSGANASSWTFAPTASGIYYVYLKVADAKGNTAQSETARIAVTAVPVGGYSIPIHVRTNTEPIIPYIALTAILTATFIKVKRKTKREH
jgi:parallel beta-helix repeat protein